MTDVALRLALDLLKLMSNSSLGLTSQAASPALSNLTLVQKPLAVRWSGKGGGYVPKAVVMLCIFYETELFKLAPRR